LKQIVQDLKTGKVLLEEVPPPALRGDGVLVRTCVSLVSAGTERMVMKLAKKGLLGKARQRPDLVRKVLAKLRRDGLLATLRTVKDRLEGQLPLGYSACGIVTAVGSRAPEFQPGQLVACAGAGYANHAQVNYVPRLLAVPVPASVAPEAAAYATLGAIALQGIRNAEARVGETVVVIGLGLIGQLACQVLAASGCRVIGLDTTPARVEMAKANGAELALASGAGDVEGQVQQLTRGRGADAVLIAAATASNAPVELAARVARDRARVVMIGVTGMEIPRTPYYRKELTFIVSRSYGPGRYDRQYEEHGRDYPAGHVRWTQQRNMEAFLDLAASGAIRPERCTTHRIPLDDALRAFELVLEGRESHLGVCLTYPDAPADAPQPEPARIALAEAATWKPRGTVGVSVVGAGSFLRSVHLPNLAKLREVSLRGIVDASGVVARSTGKRFGFAYCAATEDALYEDADTDLVLIATPHSVHAAAACRALAAGKAVFVEKPLAIAREQLEQVRRAAATSAGRLMVGFNRRFSPLAQRLKEFVAGRGPLAVHYRCNAGPLPAEHWISDPAEGGRILGEACHFFDLFAYLTGARPRSVFAASPAPGSDDALITVSYGDGSVCQLAYVGSGPASYSKERIEVFAPGRVGFIEDFRRLGLQEEGGRLKQRKLFQADKGHADEMKACLAAIQAGREMPIPLESLVETTLVGLAAVRSVQLGRPVALSELEQPRDPSSDDPANCDRSPRPTGPESEPDA